MRWCVLDRSPHRRLHNAVTQVRWDGNGRYQAVCEMHGFASEHRTVVAAYQAARDAPFCGTRCHCLGCQRMAALAPSDLDDLVEVVREDEWTDLVTDSGAPR